MICIEDFEGNHMFFTISFQKGKKYNVFEVEGEEHIGIGLFNIPLERVKSKFKEE